MPEESKPCALQISLEELHLRIRSGRGRRSTNPHGYGASPADVSAGVCVPAPHLKGSMSRNPSTGFRGGPAPSTGTTVAPRSDIQAKYITSLKEQNRLMELEIRYLCARARVWSASHASSDWR